MAKLDGIVVPVIMGLVLSAGVAAAVMLTRSDEPVVEAEPPKFTGVLKPQDTVRLRTQTALPTDGAATKGFVKAPTSQ